MSIEELRARYEEDCKHSITPWLFWEFLIAPLTGWRTCDSDVTPFSKDFYKYRRKPESPEIGLAACAKEWEAKYLITQSLLRIETANHTKAININIVLLVLFSISLAVNIILVSEVFK